jgi:hypothetical protein
VKKNLLFILLFCLICGNVFPQNKADRILERDGEIVFIFHESDKKIINDLGKYISIDKVSGEEVRAYANRRGFDYFLSQNLPYELVEKHFLSDEEANMKSFEEIKLLRSDWNYYPTYEAYIALMQAFATDYPDLCQIVEIGNTVQGRKLLAVKLSNNVSETEAEPKYFWSSSMHGDETTGYPLMLRFIDYLLSGYGNNERLTHLLDNMEIWVCPLANPDGTFHGGNSSVSGSVRSNANNKDLNRNYKDRIDGLHPDGNSWQPETLAFMAFQDAHKFNMSCNIHGGAEVCNYPWDNVEGSEYYDVPESQHNPDRNWWELTCKQYADTAMAASVAAGFSGSPQYFKETYSNGYIEGANWYQITGSRQDYENYYNHCREWTLEISRIKTLTASQLPNYWEYNYRSFLNNTEQLLYGFKGIVSDSLTDEPLYANVFVSRHDLAESNFYGHTDVYTDAQTGYYARPIKAGTYTVRYSADGYVPSFVSVSITDGQATIQNVKLLSVEAAANQDNLKNANVKVYPTVVNRGENVKLVSTKEIRFVRIYDSLGKEIQKILVNRNQVDINTNGMTSGMYFLMLDNGFTAKFEIR